MKKNSNIHIETLANESLSTFEKVAQVAKDALNRETPDGANILSNINTMRDGKALQIIKKINDQGKEIYLHLIREPAIARVVVENEHGQITTYYICRVTPPTGTGIKRLASYRSPVGRLASLSLGEELVLPNGAMYRVVEQAQFHPILAYSDFWDSQDTVIKTEYFGPITVHSLRAFMEGEFSENEFEDLVESLLAEEAKKSNVFDGLRRAVLNKMELRDQPILDKYQDEIFRLPLDKRLLILGPPGTGKTTTLIRRLGQKLDIYSLEEDEQRIVEESISLGFDHTTSWLMFTPTKLLKQFVKEAFARENVPASDHRIKTWDDYRRELARNTFSILQSTTRGVFVLKDEAQTIKPELEEYSIQFFSDFDKWQRSRFIQELKESALSLSQITTFDIAEIGQVLFEILDKDKGLASTNTFESLASHVSDIRIFRATQKKNTDGQIKSALNLQLNKDRNFIDDLSKFLDSLSSHGQESDVEEQDDDDEQTAAPKSKKMEAVKAYNKAISSLARLEASKRTLNKTSRDGKIIEWLGGRTLSKEEKAELGMSLIVQKEALPFVDPIARYLSRMPQRYKAFRLQRQKENIWYAEKFSDSSELHPLELDIILLAILKGARELLKILNVVRNIDEPAWSPLKPIFDLYKNQILVDEVTDFSPVQLACMESLSNPRFQSFFACGDFNQRLTLWGSQKFEEIKWVSPSIEKKEIFISYRQSRQLNEFARAVVLALDGTEQKVSLPEHVDCEGVSPALLEFASELELLVTWLSDRILEAEKIVGLGRLPSTAIFVNSEKRVEELAQALNQALENYNIQVIGCSKGQIIGQDHDVRVFDIQYIKGLEFEAAFFIDIDDLAHCQPKLFGKYLYVGSTRAATYLGLSCRNKLPSTIESLRHMFVPHWRTSVE